MKQFRCDYCNHAPADTREDHLGEHVCLCCDGVCDSYFTCNVCKERDTAEGCEQCLECIADAIVLDPRELDGCSKSLRADLAKVLAARLKPYMRLRQAA